MLPITDACLTNTESGWSTEFLSCSDSFNECLEEPRHFKLGGKIVKTMKYADDNI